MISDQLTEIYELLLGRFGAQQWWPGDTKFEIIVGAILTQNTNWTNVEKAISNLKSADILTAEKLHHIEAAELGELIRPAGYYKVKSRRLKNFVAWLFNEYEGQLSNLENVSTDQLRGELLAVKGIGPETADSILLYAFGRSVFVVDTYTARIAGRHGLIEAGADYSQLQQLFESNLPEDVRLFNEYHALLVRAGKEFCKPKAQCSGCPLERLPHSVVFDY